jgi:hypothetical protein
MEAKYMLLEADPELWRTLSFTRNKEKEEKLKQYLNINPEDKFIFINNNFAGPEYDYKIDIEFQTDLKIIHQEYIDGFTLLDWCGVLEQAEEIPTEYIQEYNQAKENGYNKGWWAFVKENPEIEVISYSPVSNFQDDARREKIYMEYMKKNFDIKKTWKHGPVMVKIK